MNKEDLKQLLKENLTIKVSHPKHDVGYYESYMEEDEHNVKVELFFDNELICSYTSY